MLIQFTDHLSLQVSDNTFHEFVRIFIELAKLKLCMQDTFAGATHSAYAAGRPSAALDDMVFCIQERIRNLALAPVKCQFSCEFC